MTTMTLIKQQNYFYINTLLYYVLNAEESNQMNIT